MCPLSRIRRTVSLIPDLVGSKSEQSWSGTAKKPLS